MQHHKDTPNASCGDFEIKLRGGTKTKLDNITHAQYLEGSMRILVDLVNKEGMALPEVLQHLGYL